MAGPGAVVEMAEYRLVLVQAHSREVLVLDRPDGPDVPAVNVSPQESLAHQIQSALRESWNMDALVVEFLPQSDGFPACAVAEILSTNPSSPLTSIPLNQLRSSVLSNAQRNQVESILLDGASSGGPFARIGWIDEAVAWLEAATQERISSKIDIQQYKAGGSSALLRFRVEDGSGYWLKATGPPNLHERSVTKFLEDLCTGYLPTLVSSKPEWNAWIMAEEGTRVPPVPLTPYQVFRDLEEAVLSMAEVQDNVEGRSLDLLDAGAFDQGLEVLEKRAPELFDYLEEALAQNAGPGAQRPGRKRIVQLQETFEEVCSRMNDLGLGETIVHGNLIWSNILTGWDRSQFIDWSEAYLGHPFISLQHLLDLNTIRNPEIHNLIHQVLLEKYREHWETNYDAQRVDEGLLYMPMLAIGSSLYGRGDWLNSPERKDPRRLSLARTLAKKMDRAARDSQLQETLAS